MTARTYTPLYLPLPLLPRRQHLSRQRAPVLYRRLPSPLSPCKSDSLCTTQQPTYLQATPSGQDAISKDVRLLSPSGQETQIATSPFLIGTSSDADLMVQGTDVLEEHVRIDVKNAQVFVTALGGDPEDFTSETHTTMNDNPLRSGVGYLASSGARLQIGSDENETWTIAFEEESNVNPLAEAMLKSMLAGFSQEARDAFNQQSGYPLYALPLNVQPAAEDSCAAMVNMRFTVTCTVTCTVV